MNPFLLFYIFVGAALVWGMLAWTFPKIGELIKGTKDGMKEIMEDDEEWT